MQLPVQSIEKRPDQTRPDPVENQKGAVSSCVFVCVAAAEDQKSRQMSWDNKSKQKRGWDGLGGVEWVGQPGDEEVKKILRIIVFHIGRGHIQVVVGE